MKQACESSLKHGDAIHEPIETRASVDLVPNKLGNWNAVAHKKAAQPAARFVFACGYSDFTGGGARRGCLGSKGGW